MADIYVATTGSDSTGNGTSGNPYATPGKAGSVMVGGDRVLIKAGTYTATTSSANVAGGYLSPPSGTAAAPSQVVGYNSTVGDLDNVHDFSNFPVIQNSASGDTTTIRAVNNFIVLRNLIIDSNSQGSYGLYTTGAALSIFNCKGINCSGLGGAFYLSGSPISVVRCLASGNAIGFALSGTVTHLADCVATGNTTVGMTLNSGGSQYAFIKRCLVYGNTGSTTDGILVASGTTAMLLVIAQSDIVANGRDGLRVAGALQILSLYGNVFGGNGGYNIDSTATDYSNAVFQIDYNAFYSSTTGDRHQLPAGKNDVALSGNPFTNSASGDFSLNSTAGQGAACRAAGFPGVFPGGLTTGYLDIGAAQHQDPASTGGGSSAIFLL